MKIKLLISTAFISLFCGIAVAQNLGLQTEWSLDKCITYALENNIDVRKAIATTDINKQYIKQKEGLRMPNLSANLDYASGLSKTLNSSNKYGDYSSSSVNNASLSSKVTLFNGLKISNNIKIAKLTYESSVYNASTQKESISLSVLNAYLQIIYAKELVTICEEDVKSSEEQLNLAEERNKLGLLSKSDYLQIKAQLSSDRLALTNAQSSYAVAKLDLMQLMEMPANDGFEIVYPDMSALNNERIPFASELVYQKALEVKPQIKSAVLNKEIASLNVKTAQADLWPTLSMTGTLSTAYNTALNGLSYEYQLSNRLEPSIGLTLSIPIFQQNQVSSVIKIARINTQIASLEEQSVRNELRKTIEQACQDEKSAYFKYKATLESFESTKEAYDMASEKFQIGLINSSDFIVQKTKYLSAESELLQSKYNLIFSKKIVDFYSGIPLTL